MSRREGKAPETLIEVRDAGPGLSDALLRQLASGQRFNLAEGRRAGTDSTGLGLNIVQEIMKSLGGRAVLSNRPEGGLSAVLHLPDRQERLKAD